MRSIFSSDLSYVENQLFNGYKLQDVTNSINWNNGGLNSAAGYVKADVTNRIYTTIIRGSCDAFLIYAPTNMKFALFAYKWSTITDSYVGLIQSIIPINSNGKLIIPVTMGVAYSILCGYTDDSNIDISDPNVSNIIIKKVFYNPLDITISKNSTLSSNFEIPGRSFSWRPGQINIHTGVSMTGASERKNYLHTPEYTKINPGMEIKITSNIQETTGGRAFFYDKDNNYIYSAPCVNDTAIAPNGAYNMRLQYGYANDSGIEIDNGFDLVDSLTYSIHNDRFTNFLNNIGFIPINVSKGYWNRKGNINVITDGLCSNKLYYFPTETIIRVLIDGNWVYSVMEGDTETSLEFSYRLVNYNEITITKKYAGFMFYRKNDAGTVINSNITDFNNNVLFFIRNNTTSSSTAEIHDIPDNIGILNLINRSYQMSKLTYTAVANLPTQINDGDHYSGYIPSDAQITGVMYSSVRNEGLYVPQCVSFDTYMTAILNPYSYIYTRTELEPHYNALTYYGAVCSSFVGYCLGIDTVVPTTVSFSTLDGMEVVEWQDAYALKLGDLLNRSDSHIVIVTDIIKNSRGKIEKIEISEQTNIPSTPVTIRRYRTPEFVNSNYINKGYVIYRYKYAYKIPYTPTSWINLDDESTEPIYNTYLSPRRGDKANWRPGETIEIDITDAAEYSKVELYKDEELVSSISIPTDNIITYDNLSYGSYKVRMTNYSEDSDYVYFNIIDTDTSYTPIGNGQLNITYQSNMGTASSVCFCEADPSDSDYRAVRAFHVLTEQEISNGSCAIAAPSTGRYLMKVMFKTEFGLYSSDFTDVNVN